MPTGIAIAIPEGYAGFVQPRSGLALRHGVTCLNTPGLIDAGYRDEISVLLVNLDPRDRVRRAAAAIASRSSSSSACEDVEWREVDALDDSARGHWAAGDRRAGADARL